MSNINYIKSLIFLIKLFFSDYFIGVGMKTHKKTYIFIFLLAISFALFSCSDDDTPRNAQFITLEDLRFTPGFEWFDEEYNNYQPVQSVIDSISNAIKDNNKEFILYVNPSCACTGTQKMFPASIKILLEANINEPQFKIYMMYHETDNHPYMDHYKVKNLPCFFTLTNDLPDYSIYDSLGFYNESVPDSTFRIEDFVFKAIKN